jgi:hypothetical protein
MGPPVLEAGVSSRRRSSWRRWLIVGVVVFLAVFVGAFFLADYWADREIERALAELDQTDPGWRLHDLDAARTTVPDSENSARQGMTAHALLPLPWPPPTLSLPSSLEFDPAAELSTEGLRCLRETLKKAEPAVIEARRLANMSVGRHALIHDLDPTATDLSHAQKMFDLADLMFYDALLRARQGDIDGAIESCRACSNAGRSLGEELILVCQLVRMNIRRIAHSGIEASLAHGSPSDGALASLQSLLERDEPEPLLLYGARGQRASSDAFFEAAQRGALTKEQIKHALTSFGMTSNDMSLLFFAGTIRKNRLALLHAESQFVGIARLSTWKLREGFKELEPVTQNLPVIAHGLIRPWLVGADYCHCEALALLRCDIAALAAERYRRDCGHWPGELADLVPKYLSKLPTDPFDGQALRYRRLGDGVLIYSVSEDRQDNGGNFQRVKRRTWGTDVGIRLWDVERRHHPQGH